MTSRFLTDYGICFVVPQVMSFMGFSLTCGILSTLYLFLYSQEMSISAAKELRQFTYVYERSGENIIAQKVAKPISFNPKENEDHALVGSIFGFMVVELILSMWSVGVSLAGDNFKILSEDENVSVVSWLRTPTADLFEGLFRILKGKCIC